MRPDKQKKRKPYRKVVWMVIAWLVVLWIIPRPFYEKTREQLVNELNASYDAAVETEYNGLLAKYEEDREAYERDLRLYYSDLTDYEVQTELYNEALAAYEAEYAAEISEYEIALKEHQTAQSRYESAYEAAYKKAEQDLLRRGISFHVSLRRQQNYNNHVGDDWRWGATINNQDVSDLDSIVLKLGQSVSFYSRMVESDNVPDSGSASGSVVMKEDYFRNGAVITQEVTVRENRGRYSGNTAGFTFTYTLTPEKYTVAVDESALPEVPDKPVKPVYSPPIMGQVYPVEPTEPKLPTLADVTVVPPDPDAVIVSGSDVYSRSLLASLLAFACSGLACFLVIRELIRVRRRLRQERIEAEREAFYAPEPAFIPEYILIKQFEYANGEEERINCRYADFLQRKNLLACKRKHLHFLEGKRGEPYLRYNEDVAQELERQIARTELEIYDLEEQARQRKDPLRHLVDLKERGIPKSAFAPFERAPFSKKCSVPELHEFFEQSHVSFFERGDNEVYVLNSDYVLKYQKDKLYFSTLTYDSIKVTVIDGSKEVASEPAPGKADVLGVRWKYQTKSGRPDRRFADNPAVWTVYAGQVEYRIEYCAKAATYMVKEKAEQVKAQMEQSVTMLMREYENGQPECFGKVCIEQWPDIDF